MRPRTRPGGRVIVDTQGGCQGGDDLLEAPGDDPESTPGRVHGVDQLARARRRCDRGENVGEDGGGHSREGCDPLTQGLGEIKLAVHRARGNLGDPLARARGLGQFLDDLLADERRIDVGDDEAGCPAGEQQRTRLIDTVSGAHLRTTVPFGTTVIPDSVTVKPRSTSCSRSTPTAAPSSTMTFLSRIVLTTCE